MNREFYTNSVEETIELGFKLGKLLKPGCVILLDGDLGAGKTTFTKGIGKALNIKRVINSPTFTILKQYTGDYNLAHFDAYRLAGNEDDLGFKDIIYSDWISIIEWPEYIKNILPENVLKVYINRIDDNKRLFSIEAVGDDYRKILEVM